MDKEPIGYVVHFRKNMAVLHKAAFSTKEDAEYFAEKIKGTVLETKILPLFEDKTV